jgi:tetratricopeptide (TPR) repeat protein
MGHIDRVNQAIKAHQEVAEAIKQPFQLHASAVYQTMKAILRGDFIEAERFANQAADLSHEIGLAELDGIFGIHMFTIRWEQGRLGEIAPLVKLVVAQNPESATWRPGLALIYRTLGMRDECKAIFEDLASGSFGFVPQDSLRVATLAYLTEICSFLKDADRAERLYDLLSPYQDRTVVVGGATACYGAVGRYLGMLAMTRSRYEVAEEHFRDALELDSHIEAWPWLAHSQCEYAAMLLKRGGTGDRGRAQSLLGEAANAAQRMGMGYLEQKVADLQARHEIT